MATKKSTASKKRLTPGDTGIDRWTSNGYGIVNGPVSAGRERRTRRIGLLPPRRKHERRRAYSRSGVWR